MKTAFISGNFNILHPGHLRLFRFAKELNCKLVVGVYSDKIAGIKSAINENLRLEGVLANSWVDESFIIYDSIELVIQNLKPDFVIKGKEFENQKNIEESILKRYGGKLLFSSGESTFSSLDLLHHEFKHGHNLNIGLPEDFLQRHNFSKKTLVELIHKFSTMRVCVIGDLIIDEYITCQALGMSQEDPTIVVTPIDSSIFLGGAGIVAAHASGLGAKVTFISVAGDDPQRSFALEKLKSSSVKANVFIDESRPTTLKQRFRSKGKTLLRVTKLHQNSISSHLQKNILEEFKKVSRDIDLLIFSDFNYGVLGNDLIGALLKIAKDNNIKCAADSQSSSQIGDICKFTGVNLLTPTEHEARISAKDNDTGLIQLAEKIRKSSHAQNILLKLGEEGLLIHASTENNTEWLTDRIAPLNPLPKDTAGAGDSLMVASSLTLAAGGSIWEAAVLGSLAAAIQISRIGNTPLQKDELLLFEV